MLRRGSKRKVTPKKRLVGDCVFVLEDLPLFTEDKELIKAVPHWSAGTHEVGTLWKDSRPHGKRFKQIKRKLGPPTYEEWEDDPTRRSAEEWSELPVHGPDWWLEWLDGVYATLYFRRDESETPEGQWNVGSSNEHAREALKRLRAMFGIRRKGAASSGRKRNQGRARQDPDTLQRFVETKTREIIRAVDEGWDEADIEDLEAERDAVLEELGHHGAAYRERAQQAINRIESEAARASYYARGTAPRGKQSRSPNRTRTLKRNLLRY